MVIESQSPLFKDAKIKLGRELNNVFWLWMFFKFGISKITWKLL